jgi:subtilisin family serine protease
MKKMRDVFLVTTGAILCFLAGRADAGESVQAEMVNGREAVAGEALVKFRGLATAQTLTEANQQEDLEANTEIGGTAVRLFRSRSKSASTLIEDVSSRPDVEFVEPNYIVYADAVPNDPLFGELWGLQNTGQVILGFPGTPGADIGASSAWDLTTGSRDNVVAVVDTGIDYTHPDLAANVWSAPAAFTVSLGGVSITCPAGSHGFNAITNSCDPMDDNDHGSHCSGTIGAVGNNGAGVAGVNWTASVMGAKFLGASGSGTTANAIKAIEFTIQTKLIFGAEANVRVLSNSWGGGGFSQALLDEINRANQHDILFVAAAGNNGTDNDLVPHYPSTYNAPNMIAVAATENSEGADNLSGTANEVLASFSNWGNRSVHLAAPGTRVLSTIRGGQYAYFSGTSMATPHVSGAAALVLSYCDLNTADLRTTLLGNVDLISRLAELTTTGGRLNVNRALRDCAAANR